MRNLKRALSLTLASVMLLGMMVVGAGAAGYPDVDSNDNAEAIEVLQAVKVMVGDDNGNFGPDDQVNRAQMAVVMALLLDLNYDYYEGADPGFWDVPSWAAPYVAACYANGIVSGYGNGQYGSADSVTAVQAASMMMRALGYFKYQSDYKEGFELSTVSQASKLRLFDGIAAKSNEPLTRNDVAQLALNTLKTPIVEPSDKTISFTDANGNVVATGGQVDYVVVASNQPFAQAIDRVERSGDGLNQVNGYTVELGEQLYNGKLELRDNGQDDFGRPARTWVYNGSEIGSYAKKELLRQSYTAAVKGKTIYELVGQAPIRDYTLLPYLDGAVNSNITEGVLTRNNNTDLYGTGRGVLTEVYLDNNRDELYIVSINTWLARASADYNSNSESITMTVYDGINSTISKRVELEDAPFIMNMKKDDWCLINWNGDVLDGSSDKVVANVFDVEIREDQKVTAFKRGVDEYNNTNTGRQDRVTQMTANGETYDNNKKAFYKYNTLNEFNANELVNKTYTMFMDQYGYFIGAELYSGKDQYVFITGYDRNGSNISVNTAKASAIFTDGTMQAIDVNAKDTDKNIKNYNDKNYSTGYDELKDCDYVRWSTRTAALNHDGYEWENMWYKYSLYNGVYTLTPVDEYTKEINTDTNSSGVGVDRTINAKKVYLVPTRGVAGESLNRDGRSYGEDASIYITVDNGDVDLGSTKGITDVTGVYTGAQDVNLVLPHGRWIHAVYDDTYIVAAIVFGDAEGSVNNYAYIRSGANHEQIETVDGSTIHYWDFDAVMDGETVTKTIKSKFSNTVDDLRPGTVQELILDNDGYVTKIKDVEDNRPGEGSVDKTYNNANFNAGHKTLADYEAYQIATTYSDPVPNGWIIDAPQAGPAIPGAILLNNGRYASTLTFQGNTLHYSANANDIGLPVSRNAKAVVYQRINNGNSWENYGSVQSAYNVLNDADTVTPGKQFDGQVIAVLDSNGVAAWVVFIDATPTNSNTGINTGTDTYTDGNITVTVNNTNIKARDVSANVTNGNLTITIPTSVTRTAGYDQNGLRVEVTVNGRYYGLAEYVRSTSSRYVYTMDGLALRTTDKVVITISAEKDAPVDPNPPTPSTDDVKLNNDSKGTSSVKAKDGVMSIVPDNTDKRDGVWYLVTIGDKSYMGQINNGTLTTVDSRTDAEKENGVTIQVEKKHSILNIYVEETGTVYTPGANRNPDGSIEFDEYPVLPAPASKMARSARVGEFSINGLAFAIPLSEDVVVKLAFNDQGKLVMSGYQLEKLEAAVGANPELEDAVITAEALPAPKSEVSATIENNVVKTIEVTVDKPASMAQKLPEVGQQDGVEVQLEWYYTNAAGEQVKVEGDYAPVDPEQFPYSFKVIASTTKETQFDKTNPVTVVVNTVNQSGEEVTVKGTITVDENTGNTIGAEVKPDVKPEENLEVKPDEKPVEPAKKWIITVDGPKEGVAVTGADNLDAVPDGTVITVTPVEGYTVKVGEEELTAAKEITVTDNVTIYVVKNPEKAKYVLTLKTTQDTKPVVYMDGTEVKALTEENNIDLDTMNKSSTRTYEITEGSDVMITGAGASLADGSYEVGEAKVPVTIETVTGNVQRITFKMPASAFELSFISGKPEGSEEVKVVTVKNGVKGTWKLDATSTEPEKSGELTDGKNTMPMGAVITITDTGAGAVVLKDGVWAKYTEPVQPTAGAENNSAKVFVAEEAKGETEITVDADMTLYSAALVENKTGAAITGIKDATFATSGKLYVAIGEKLKLADQTGVNYLVNAGETPTGWAAEALVRGSSGYEVPVSADKNILISKAHKVTVGEGITVNVVKTGEKDTVTGTVAGVAYVADDYKITAKVTSPKSGVAVVNLKNGVMAGNSECTFTTTNAGERQDLNLSLAYMVTLGEGITAKWNTSNSTNLDEWADLTQPSQKADTTVTETVYWALEGTFIRASATSAPAPTAEGGKFIESSATSVTFQVETSPVSVRQGDAEATTASGMSGTLVNLLKTVAPGDTITLQKAVTLSAKTTLTENFTLDLNGYELTVGANFGLWIDMDGNKANLVTIKNGTVKAANGKNNPICVYAGAKLNLEEVDVEGNGCIFVGNGDKNETKSATLNITGGTLTATGTNFSDGYAAISTNGNNTKTNHIITVKDATITNKKSEAFYLPGMATVTLTNCTVEGKNGISIKAGTLNLAGTTSVAGTSTTGTVTDEDLNTNGSNETGAAISIFGQTPPYAGNVVVNIETTVNLTTAERTNEKKTDVIVIAGANPEAGSDAKAAKVYIGGVLLTKDNRGDIREGWTFRLLEDGVKDDNNTGGSGNDGNSGSTGDTGGGSDQTQGGN